MPDSGVIDDAVVAKLSSDATLIALMPDGVYFDEAPASATRFVLLSVTESHDEPQFGGRAWEEVLYLVKAVDRSSSSTSSMAAAAQIEALLEDQPLTASGYTWMSTVREIRDRHSEVDEINTAIVWQHHGAFYRVSMSVD